MGSPPQKQGERGAVAERITHFLTKRRGLRNGMPAPPAAPYQGIGVPS